MNVFSVKRVKRTKAQLFSLAFMLGASLTMAQELDIDVPVGWAIVPSYGVESTIGGGNGNVVTATTLSQLSAYAGSSQPLVILVEGTMSGDGDDWIIVKSNKTIIGKGSNALLTGVGISLNNASNVIIRNLTITGSVDAIATRGSHHVWIDHCDVSNCGDGLIDITQQSDIHTVSWTRLSNHDKTMLLNSGTSKAYDLNKLNTTLHHLWYDGTNQRNPRAGYGKIHMFNCLLSNNGSYGIGLHSQARVLAQRNYFDHVQNPIQQMYRPNPNDIHHGFCESVENIFVSSVGKRDDDGISFPVNQYYMYDFMLDTAANVPSIVQSSVGPSAEYEEIGLLPIPGMGAMNVSTSPTLSWTKGQSAISYIVHFGSNINELTDITQSGQTYVLESLDSATVYYWSVDQINSSDTIQGKVWVFETSKGLPTVSITSPASETIFPGTTSEITISANATDINGAIDRLEFFHGVTSLGVDSISPYSYTWENALAGEHMLSAKVTDNHGNTVTSPLVYIKKENSSPSVSITSPSKDTTFDAVSSITIIANASDTDGKISTVKFYSGSTFVGSDVNSPYSYTWSDLADGTYSITAVATDDLKATTTSEAVNITIINATGILTENSSQKVIIYPVPAKDQLKIEFGHKPIEELNIYLFDISGKILYSKQTNDISQTLDISGYSDGFYLVKISGKNMNVMQKISKQ